MKFYLDRHTVHFVSALLHLGWVVALTLNPNIVFTSQSHMAMENIMPSWVWALTSAAVGAMQVAGLPGDHLGPYLRQWCEFIGSYASSVWWMVLAGVFYSSGAFTTGDTTYTAIMICSIWATRYVPAYGGPEWKSRQTYKSHSSRL
jgi:hypothetical protein